MSSGLDYRTSAWLRHLVNAYGVISLVRLIAAAQRRVWQLLAWLNPVVIPGLRAGTCAVMRGSLLIVCKCVCHLSTKELLYFTLVGINSSNGALLMKNIQHRKT